MPKHLKTVLIAMWVVAGLTVGGVIAAVSLRAKLSPPTDGGHALPHPAEPTAALPVLFDAPPFKLTDADGRPFDSTSLRGTVWVADFVYTTCTSFCPQMTAGFADLQQETANTPAVQLVSFTVNPDVDTPAVLKQYAALHRADPARWHFLTGDRATMWDLSIGMKLSADVGDSAMQVMHSSHYLLVDQKGRVRGVYDFKDDGYVTKIAADARRLLAGKTLTPDP